MKKDWVIWTGCVLLFGAGVLWGLIWTKADFFHVQNIHDLAEIASSIATVAAVFIALTVWKKQLRAQADHDLARRVVVSIERFKRATLSLIVDAKFCCGNSSLQYADYPLIERIEAGITSRLSTFDDETSTFEGLMVEARAIWGTELDDHLGHLREIAARTYDSNRQFLIFLNESANPDLQETLEAEVDFVCDRLNALGLDGEPKNIYRGLNEFVAPADAYLKNKLMM